MFDVTGGEMAMNTILGTELETYAAHKAELLAFANGQYVLIHGAEVGGTFETEQDAVNRGYGQYGNVPFLVKQVVEVDQPANFVSGLVAL